MPTVSKTANDMTPREFVAAVKKRGWTIGGPLGYVSIPNPRGGKSSLNIHPSNYGNNRRHQLKCLIREADKYYADCEEKWKNGLVRDAAPDLLEACEAIVFEADRAESEAEEMGWGAVEIMRRTIEKARVAIAKAKGHDSQ